VLGLTQADGIPHTGGAMKRLAFLTTLVLVLTSVFLTCKNSARSEAETNKTFSTENHPRMGESDKPKAPTLAEVGVAESTAKGLMHNFKYTKDAFTGKEEFVHKNNETAMAKSLTLLASTGTPVAWFSPGITRDHLSCLYTCSSETDNMLHFETILVKIDEKIEIELIQVEGKTVVDTNRIRSLAGIGEDHNIEFYNSLNDKIIRFIALNSDKTVLVRFEGKDRHRDFTLDKAQHEAICQTVELYDALMLLKRAGVDTSTIVNIKPAQTPQPR
jgi:hypothetical protein